jgi:LmbE family N-acetylglucosaminyl deacetylase
MVFIPSTDDTHQDHQVVSHEGFRAFKRTTLVGYELPWNNLTFKASFFVRLSPEDVGRKVEAIHAYRSQADHLYTTEDFLRGLARVRGVQIGAGYAEAFEVLRWII